MQYKYYSIHGGQGKDLAIEIENEIVATKIKGRASSGQTLI